MPLDPNIPLSVKQPEPFNGLAQLGQIRAQQQEQQIRQQQLAMNQEEMQRRQTQAAEVSQGKRQAAEIQTAAQQAYEQINGGNPDAVFSQLKPEVRTIVEGWHKDFSSAKQARDTQAETDAKRTAKMIQALDYNPVVAAASIQLLGDVYPEAKDMLQHVESPEALKKIVDHFATLGDKPVGTREVKTRNPDGTETTQIVADTPGQSFTSAAAPKPVPTNFEAAILQASAAKDWPEVRRLTVLKGQTAAAGRAPEQGTQQSWQWVKRDGKDVYTNRVAQGDTPRTAPEKATEDQRKMAGFYGQMSDAVTILDTLEPALTEKELYQIQTLPQEALTGMVNRGQLSEGAKRYLRAFEQFTESRLRPVSGAAIADSEYARDRRTYARQYAETPQLAKDRQAARARALESLRSRAGVALDDGKAPAGGTKADPLGLRD